jgi:uncharacterized protein
MNQQEQDLVHHRLRRASEALREAALLLDNGFASSAVGKSYYAAFYAVSALLLTRGLFSKTHKGTRVLFGKHFIETGIFPISANIVFTKLFRYRQEGDYGDYTEIDAATAQALCVEARDLVESIALYVTRQMKQSLL